MIIIYGNLFKAKRLRNKDWEVQVKSKRNAFFVDKTLPHFNNLVHLQLGHCIRINKEHGHDINLYITKIVDQKHLPNARTSKIIKFTPESNEKSLVLRLTCATKYVGFPALVKLHDNGKPCLKIYKIMNESSENND